VAERHLGKITCLPKQPSGRTSPATHLTVNLPLEQVVASDGYDVNANICSPLEELSFN